MIPIRDDTPSRTTPVVTCLLILANVVVFGYELSLPPPALEALVMRWGIVPAHAWRLVSSPDPDGAARVLLPFVTSMFLHGGWLHLIGNAWILWLFGDNVEDRLGHFRFLLFYVSAGILAGLLHALLHPSSHIPTIGASGAIAGVMGAYFLLYPFARVTVLIPVLFLPLIVKLPAAVYLLIWIAIQVAGGWGSLAGGGSAVGGIAFWAHVGGFVAGMLLIRKSRPRRRRH